MRGWKVFFRSPEWRSTTALIEVLDGEIVPPGALRDALPEGAWLHEATGNKGASLELQYRRAVLVVWRRNEATLRMFARCGVREVIELWQEALAPDGGAPEPRVRSFVLDAMSHAKGEGEE